MKKIPRRDPRAGRVSTLEIILVAVILFTVCVCVVYFYAARKTGVRATPVDSARQNRETAARKDAALPRSGYRSITGATGDDRSRRDRLGAAAGAGMAASAPLPDEVASNAVMPPAVPSATPPHPEDSAALVADFKQALLASDPLAAFGKDRIQRMSAKEIQACLDVINNMEPGPEATQLLQAVVSHWAETDPQAAADYTMTLTSLRLRASLMTSVVENWAKTDLKATAAYVSGMESQRTRSAVINTLISAWSATDAPGALAWLRENSNVDRGALASSTATLFRNLVKQNSDQALAEVWSLTDMGMKRAALQAVVDAMTEAKSEAALMSSYGQMTTGADRTLMAQAIVENMARYQPQKAAEWIAQNITDADERNRAISRLVASWSYDQPEQAILWVSTQLTDADQRRSQLGRVMDAWVRDDPAKAAAWLSQYSPSAQTDPAARALAAGLVRTDPQAAATWAESITDENLRYRAIREVAAQWMAKDPEQAKAYIAASTLPDETKTRLMEGGGNFGFGIGFGGRGRRGP